MKHVQKQGLKPFVGWVIALSDKYHFDLIFRTYINIIALQFVYIIFLLIFFWISINTIFENLKSRLIADSLIITDQSETTSVIFTELVHNSKIDDVTYVFFGLTLATAFMTLIIVYLTFQPIRMVLGLQKNFISNIAHELRTPLSLLKTSTEVALMTEDISQTIQKTLKRSIQEIDRISNTINNLLSFSKLLRVETIKFTEVELREIVILSVKRLKQLARSRRVKIIVTTKSGFKVYGNMVALEQLVMNLIKNAIEYSPKNKNSPVHVSINSDHHCHINLIVKDNGIGIEKKDAFHILEPFYRVDKSRTKKNMSSSGLGLAIVSEIAKLHRAAIFIRSTPGQGTTMRVRFPEASHWSAHAKPYTN